ncbi:hypothetical protein SAMN06297164_0166 [Nitrosomonas ureae]|uniref:Uncharacterized protein n=1 Tax=Nitrosomonas ureae TaxID=44577 RepID=A0A286A252_9PROT|nr:hypothetical protein SAMN06297164_0166 [Nitrosomonas ureae]
MIINGTDYGRMLHMARIRIHEQIEGAKSKDEMIYQKDNLLIVSEGYSWNTQVYCSGEKLENVTSVEILPLLPGEPLRARIEVFAPCLHLRANCED